MSISSTEANHLLTASSYEPPVGKVFNKQEYRKIIPIGKPYLTKLNGKLVFARDIPKRKSRLAFNLLGEAFGFTTKTVHKRSKSVDTSPKGPILIDGVMYIPQVQPGTHSVPIPQQPFSAVAAPMAYVSYPPHALHHLISQQCPPTRAELRQVTKLEADFNGRGDLKTIEDSRAQIVPELKTTEIKTASTFTKHVCANCGRLRSRKYHQENPTEPCENAFPAFCRKCQRDVSSTSCPGTELEISPIKRATKSSKVRLQNAKEKTSVENSMEQGPRERLHRKTSSKVKKSEGSQARAVRHSKKSSHQPVWTRKYVSQSPRSLQRERNLEKAKHGSLADQHLFNNTVPSHQTLWKEENGPRGRTLPFVDTQMSDNPEFRSPRVDDDIPVKENDSSKPNKYGQHDHFEPKIQQGDERGNSNNKNGRLRSNNQLKQLSLHGGNSHSQSFSSQVEDLRGSRVSSKQPELSIESTIPSNTIEPEKSCDKYHSRRQGQTVIAVDHSNKQRTHSDPLLLKILPLDAEELLEISKAVPGRILDQDCISRKPGRDHPVREPALSVSVQSSRSNSSHNIIKRASCSIKSISSIAHKFSAVGSVKTCSDEGRLRGLNQKASGSFFTDRHHSGSFYHEESFSPKMTERCRRGRKPPPSDHGEDHPSKDGEIIDTSPSTCKIPDGLKGNFRNREHDIASKISDQRFAIHAVRKVSSVSSQTPKYGASESQQGVNNWHNTFVNNIGEKSGMVDVDVSQHRTCAIEDDSAMKPSSQMGARSRNKHGQNSLPSTLRSLSDPVPAYFDKFREVIAEPIEHEGVQPRKSHDCIAAHNHHPQRDSKAHETETAFSTADAAKHYQEDWSNTQNRDVYLEDKEESASSTSDVRFPQADPSRYYQDDWRKKDAGQNSEISEAPQQNAETKIGSILSEVSRIDEFSATPLPSVPAAPSPFIDQESECTSKASPSRRRHMRTLRESKGLRAPSTIWEESEHAQSRYSSQHSSRGRRTSKHTRSPSPSEHSSQAEDLSTKLSVDHQAQEPQSSGSLDRSSSERHRSGSDDTVRIERHAEQSELVQPTADTNHGAPTTPADSGWYTVTESTLDMIARQEAVPGFGMGNPGAGWRRDANQDSGRREANGW